MSFELQPTLRGRLVELHPLRAEDFDALYAVASDRLIWEQHPASDRYQRDVFTQFFREAMESGGAFLVRDASSGAVIGSSRFCDYDEKKRQVEVGWTFLARSHWGGRYNGEMKALMLDHAFRFVDTVVFLIGPNNIRSQKAVEKIGASRAGVIQARGHDAVVYQLTASQVMTSRPSRVPDHIGIVGCSAEGAALCYRTICVEGSEAIGRHDHPEVTMHTHPLASYMRCIGRGDWAGVGELMLSSAQKLAGAGAALLICPDNTIHQALPHIEARSPLPWLHIAEVVAAEASARGFHRIGLTGTRWLVESEVYPQKLAAYGLEYVRPDAGDREAMNAFIFDELAFGIFSAAAVAGFQRVMEGMKQQGCDAVVLGCTEIPLIMNDGNSPLPTLDSTRLLARAALRRAVAGAASV